MSFFGRFRSRRSAPIARERLKVLLAYERTTRGQFDLLAVLRDEILAVIAKHVNVDRDQVQVTMDLGERVAMLEINVEIPHSAMALSVAG